MSHIYCTLILHIVSCTYYWLSAYPAYNDRGFLLLSTWHLHGYEPTRVGYVADLASPPRLMLTALGRAFISRCARSGVSSTALPLRAAAAVRVSRVGMATRAENEAALAPLRLAVQEQASQRISGACSCRSRLFAPGTAVRYYDW